MQVLIKEVKKINAIIEVIGGCIEIIGKNIQGEEALKELLSKKP